MKRIASFALALIMIFTMTATAFAGIFAPADTGNIRVSQFNVTPDMASVAAMDVVFEDLYLALNISVDMSPYWWDIFDTAIRGSCIIGSVTEQQLHRYATALTSTGTNSLLTGVNNFLAYIAGDSSRITKLPIDLVVLYDESYGVYRLYDRIHNVWLVTSTGAFPYYRPAEDGSSGDRWVLLSSLDLSDRHITDYDTLSKMCISVRNSTGKVGADTQKMPDGVFGAIMYTDDTAAGNRWVWADAEGHPYCYSLDDRQFALNTEQNYYTETNNEDKYQIGDWVGDLLVDNSESEINDITNNYSLSFGDLVFREGDTTYNVDAHKEYYVDLENNTYYYYEYNYEFTYHINYTSVTYIGQTAEYNETYEFYYQLPDGRSSADLTVEELQALNTQIDVLPYIRSADDTSIRALYHFDGDTFDSSYWSYAGNIEWISGASLTYMDAGAFNGALFLDETAHEFNVQLPSNLGSSDFTIQFRYYQSATLAPVTDSHISIGSNQVLQLSGDAFILSNGVTVPTSIGQWTELCFMRSGNTLYYFYNGVPIGFTNFTGTVSDVLNFTFGSEQQTYKYFDELRVTSKALYVPGGYTPTSVPFDTNLSLVLPDSKLPIADAYWDIKSSGTNILSQYGLDHWINVGEIDRLHENTSGVKRPNVSYENFSSWPYSAPCFWYNTAYSVLNTGASGTSISNLGTSSGFAVQIGTSTDGSGTPLYAPSYGLVFPLAYTTKYSWAAGAEVLDSAKTYTLSIVFADSSIESFSFNPHGGGSAVLDGYTISVGSYLTGKASASRYGYAYYLVITPTETDCTGKEFVYMELVEGNSTDLTAEYVESVVAMDKDDLNTPSLAVRTDINITGYQIGGVRPSLPTKGLVWALVEDSMITSLQIYNGQAWEAVDGRIWTGSRWVPYYAYDVILLKDLYDIVESDPSLDYIYTESGFWKWLQGAWSQMMGQLSDIENAISGSGSGSGTINPNIPDVDKTGFFESLGDIFLSIFSSIGDLLTGIFGFFSDTVFGGIRNFFSVFTDGSLFEGFQQTDEEGNTTTALPDGVSAVFAFFAGIFLVLPEEIRLILLFAIGLLIFMGVLKVVIS